jgi:hypothetical protein
LFSSYQSLQHSISLYYFRNICNMIPQSLQLEFCEHAAIFDHTVRGALSPPHTSRALGFVTQDHAQARDSSAAQSNTRDMKATSANLLRKECQSCSEAES